MFSPAFLEVQRNFYPLAETPATCLTQHLPPGDKADILMLGCGDVSKVLFTAHTDDRLTDVTCCDIEREVIARNVMLLTLLIDDKTDKQTERIWNIFYHFKLDKSDLVLLQQQARKLHALASSLATWHNGPYGRHLRFCDSGTLAQVRNVWAFYGSIGNDPADHADSLDYFAKTLKVRECLTGILDWYVPGYRAAGPTQVEATGDLHGAQEHFWATGTTDNVSQTMSKTMQANPMFASPYGDISLHHEVNPLPGFHLATAYFPLHRDSSLRPEADEKRNSAQSKAALAARREFRVWGNSFRERIAKERIVIRVFVGDAIAFAYTLQHRHQETAARSAGWYRTRFQFDPLVLDGPDYGLNGSAPKFFNVIDTSDLAGDDGTLVLLTATSPLLSNQPTATLYTEVLVKQELPRQEALDHMLCGDFTTVSVILGLVLAEYWTNRSTSSSGEEAALTFIANGSKPQTGDIRIRLEWKRPVTHCTEHAAHHPLQRLTFEAQPLAHVLVQVWRRMKSQPMNFIPFLQLAKTRIDANWEKASHPLVSQIILERETMTTMIENRQEFSLALYLAGFWSAGHAKDDHDNTRLAHRLLNWREVPSTLCVTLEVPHAEWKSFSKVVDTQGRHILQCTLQNGQGPEVSPWESTYTALQLGFGSISTSATKHSNDYKLAISESSEPSSGWNGSSSLFVSFRVSTWILLKETQTARIHLELQPSPVAKAAFKEKIGAEMVLNISSTTLGDSDRVHLTREMPNQSHMAKLVGFGAGDSLPVSNQPGSVANVAITANVVAGKIASFTARIDQLSAEFKSALGAGHTVQFNVLSPFSIAIFMRKQPRPNTATASNVDRGARVIVNLPIPTHENRCSIRLSRKQFYIEYTAPVVGDVWKVMPHLAQPTFFYHDESNDGFSRQLVAWNTPYLNMETLPTLDQSSTLLHKCINQYLMNAQTKQERSNRAAPMTSALGRTFKKSLDHMFGWFRHNEAPTEPNMQVFGLRPYGAKLAQGQIFVLISSLRLDLSNRTFVFDAAVLPISARNNLKAAEALSKVKSKWAIIELDPDAMKMWRHCLPAYVERCRTWEHKPGCEYQAHGRVPLFDDGVENILCNCGNGIFPDQFFREMPKWSPVAKIAVRAAITHSFPSALVEELDGIMAPIIHSVEIPEGCRVCGKLTTTSGADLSLCARCKWAKYCSAECQTKDWKAHKKLCKMTASAAN